MHCGAHGSMLNRNGSHMSTHTASIRFRCRLTKLGTKEIIQRFLLPLAAKPYGCGYFRTTHNYT